MRGLGFELNNRRRRGSSQSFTTTDTQSVTGGITNYTDTFNNVTAVGFLNSYAPLNNIGSVTDGTSNLYNGGTIKVLAHFVDNLDSGRTNLRFHILTPLRNVVPWTTMTIVTGGSTRFFSRGTAMFQEISANEIAFLWTNISPSFSSGEISTVTWS